jgi:threonylcarbamoyladenosine tRNA methylthiotransferase MtaB
LGCKLNQNEMETLARELVSKGHTVVPEPESADAIVLNTCTVTQVAARKSRQLARRLHRANQKAEIVLTGCFTEMSPDEAANLPGVRRVIGNRSKEQLPELLGPDAEASATMDDGLEDGIPHLRTRALVKIQDGCDNHCTYCIVRIARGSQRSRRQQDIIEEINTRLEAGYQEVVLTGVHIGAYGRDQGQMGQTDLWSLVESILHQTDLPRLRLSSIEPWDISIENLALWQDQRLCRHLHLPLQSGSDSVLSRMGRRYTVGEFARFVEVARQSIPDTAITTDLIAGFPGETEQEFQETMDFVETAQFSRIHVFPFSSRAGTLAAHFPNQIDPQTKQERAQRLAEIGRHSETTFRSRFVGRTLEVLWETQKGQDWQGLTDNYVRVSTHSSAPLHNRITPVHILGLVPGGLRGHLTGPFDTTAENPDQHQDRPLDSERRTERKIP